MTPRLARATILAGSFLAVAALHARAAATDPQIVLDEVYGQVAETCSGDATGAPYDLVAIANTYFAPALAKTVIKASLDGSLGFDVLVDAQDCKMTALDLRVVEQDKKSAIGRAEFQNFGEPRTIDLLMAKAGGKWKITDVVYRHRPFSLAKVE